MRRVLVVLVILLSLLSVSGFIPPNDPTKYPS